MQDFSIIKGREGSSGAWSWMQVCIDRDLKITVWYSTVLGIYPAIQAP